MNPDRWQQIQVLFRAAFELEASARVAFLDRICAGDGLLRAEVEALLASDALAGGFIEDAVRAGVESLARDPVPSPTGRRIGPYQIQRELGRGGMSTVYLGGRADGQYERRVALKLIRRGMDTEDILRRFRNERQILASLDHPHIARLLDGGTTEDGLPYFAMEYIEGVPIDQYCDHLKLSILERLRLFRTVCGAVEYAHQNLVVHRDLKPSNILVTADGVAKLLDFGIAKLLDPEMAPLAIEPTATAARLMTPGYASPEQVRGRNITTVSDVYSLGVLLYELLTGHRPYRVEGRLPQEIERIICQEEPEKPSAVVSRVEKVSDEKRRPTPHSVSQARDCQPEHLRRQLAGDLDNIVLMALHKEPQQRYGSVAQLSEDIRRHLDGLPVTARKATLRYRSAKFIRRNKVAAIVALTLLAMAIALAVSIIVQSARTARERDKAQQVSAFLVNLFEVSDPGEAKGNSLTAREVLDHGARKISQELEDQPEVRATLMDTLGKVYQRLGLYDNAQPLLEMGLALRRKTLGNNHRDVAVSLNNLGDLLQMKGEYEQAEPLYREALNLRRSLFGEEHPAVAESLNSLGDLLHDKGEYERAEPLYREALKLRRAIFGEEHADVAESLNNLALLHHDRAEYDQAEALYRQSLALRRRLLGEEHPKVAQSLHNLGALLRARSKLDAAEPLLREALAINRKLLGGEHPSVTAGLNNLGRLLQDKGDYEAAEQMLREAVMIDRKRLGEEHPDFATSLHYLASLYDAMGNDEAAEPLYRQSVDIYSKALPSEHPYTARPLVALGLLLTRKGDHLAAELLLRKGLEIRRKVWPAGDWRTAEAASALGACLTSLGRFAEAEPLLLESQPIIQEKFGDRNARSLEAIRRLIGLYEAWGKPGEAARYRAMQPPADQPVSQRQ